MAVILGMKDTLDEEVARFDPAPLKTPLFLNSIPKGGTHLIRNILRMFVPVAQHYGREFVQIPNLAQHRHLFDPARPMMSCGHLLFSDSGVHALGGARHIVLARDPHSWVLARARFYLSEEFQQPNLAHLKSGAIPADELINMMIFGIHDRTPTLEDMYTHNVVAWMGTPAVLYRYEDIVAAVDDLDSKASEAFFERLLADCGLEVVPANWRERVRVGADRRQSRTARQNLNVTPALVLPDEISETQKRLIEFHAPGLRALLGYA
ncbi:hypothetical protein GVN18_38425 [Pseudomonas sp. ODNR1LW]|nr:hypothetical protein [Pseudomonas sp. ODNR1LW]